MTEKAMRCVKALKICHSNEDCRDCEFSDSDRFEKSCVNILFEESADLIETLSAQAEAARQKWISVDSREKPIHGHRYLCVCTLQNDKEHKYDWVSVLTWHCHGTNGYVDRPHFTDEGVNGMVVTHWMQLPELPKENT